MDNKEVITNLKSYFLKQDHDVLAHALAAFMIDFNRIYYYNSMPEEERKNLGMRLKANVDQLQEFMKSDFTTMFELINIETQND